MRAGETDDSCLGAERCVLPSLKPHPRPGGGAMFFLPLAYVAMGVCYFLALRSPTNGFWYPPIAFGKLLFLVYGPQALIPVLASEMVLMGVQYGLVAKVGFLAAGLVSVATTAEALIAWWLLRMRPIEAPLNRPGDLVRLLLYAGLIPNVAGAVIGIALLRSFVQYSGQQIAPAAMLWAFGDFVTTVTWLPFFAVWVAPTLCGVPTRRPAGMQLLELGVVLLVSAVTCVLVAVGMMRQPHLQEYHLKFLCFLPLIWAGIRFGLPGATASLAVSSTAWAMLYGNARPLDIVDLAVTIEQVQVFNLALGVGGLTLGWAIDAERHARELSRRLSDDLQLKEARLREAFDAVAVAQERADRAREVKSRFLSVVSHELRTPLTPMALVLSELARRADVPAEVRESAEMAMRQVEREAAIVEELLEYADLMCGAEMRRCDSTWQTLAAPIWDAIERDARDAQVTVTWTVPAGGLALWLDPRRSARAILHVVRHAVRLSRPGGEVEVHSSIHDNRLTVQCNVRNAREGARPAAAEPFSAAAEPLGNVEGLGLSIASARIIAERHNGSLHIVGSGKDGSMVCTLVIDGSRNDH